MPPEPPDKMGKVLSIPPPAIDHGNPTARRIEYLSPPAKVKMADQWFEVSSTDHFWIRRRFEVFQQLAGQLVAPAKQIAEFGCGHGLLQRQVEDVYGREVSGFDLNEHALNKNVSRISTVSCYDIFQAEESLKEKFDLIFLFDVLEHIDDEDRFLKALIFHLRPTGHLVINVPAGQWMYSRYDWAAGHVRRYSMQTLLKTAARARLKVKASTYWGIPLVPTVLIRKLLLLGGRERDKIITKGFDVRRTGINRMMWHLSRCERIPQMWLGTSILAVFSCLGYGENS